METPAGPRDETQVRVRPGIVEVGSATLGAPVGTLTSLGRPARGGLEARPHRDGTAWLIVLAFPGVEVRASDDRIQSLTVTPPAATLVFPGTTVASAVLTPAEVEQELGTPTDAWTDATERLQGYSWPGCEAEFTFSPSAETFQRLSVSSGEIPSRNYANAGPRRRRLTATALLTTYVLAAGSLVLLTTTLAPNDWAMSLAAAAVLFLAPVVDRAWGVVG